MRRNYAHVNEESSVRNKYFEWLCHIVETGKQYGQLLHFLHTIEFYSFVPNDENREVEGRKLREEFEDREGRQALSLFPDEPCTILEMLIALSDRLHLETEASRYEKSPGEWFWILIENLHLCWADDRHFDRDEIQTTIENMLERHYDDSGEGGLFPLKHPKEDQRDVEIWYQMSAYILENYRI